MRILVIGGGGREHALAWKLSRSPQVSSVLVAPGNGGITGEKLCCAALSSPGVAGVVALAEAEKVDLTVVGPEAWLANGLVDALAAAGHRCFGPTKAAAQLEASKAFAKDFMACHGIPTARGEVFGDVAAARAFINRVDYPVVIKASGLAAGKGVLLPDTTEQASAALERIMVAQEFGAAGNEVVIEERLAGQEASVIAFCDGVRYCCLPAAQDHKRVFAGDKGANTGGMGAYAPAPVMTPALMAEVEERVMAPTLAGMAADGHGFVGFLYAGLMITEAGPQVLEFNVRLGDPEAQVLMPLLASDLVDLVEACLDGDLTPRALSVAAGAAATVVVAAGGYPGSYHKGDVISGLDRAAQMPGVTVFHAGTRRDGDQVVTAGGRVLAVTATADDLDSALTRAYDGVEALSFAGMHYRRDIGWRALGRAVGDR